MAETVRAHEWAGLAARPDRPAVRGYTPWVMLHLALLLLLLVGQNEDLLAEVPEEYYDGVNAALLRSNDAALKLSFMKLEPGAERRAWAFLVAKLPAVVIDELPEATLTENVMYACRAREGLPWAADVPEREFRHHVLPFPVPDRKPNHSRKTLFEEVVPILRKKRVETIGEAALLVNLYCREKMGPPPGDGKLAAEFYVAAARAAGIPARIVFTPYWTLRAGGRHWCEVRTKDGEWHWIAPCEPAKELDEGPFAADLGRTALVLARDLEGADDGEVLVRDDPVVVFNRTKRYAKTCRMTLEVREADGKPARRPDVGLYMFNEEGGNAHLRAVIAATADEDGRSAFDLGPGDYLFQAISGADPGWTVARSTPGGEVTCAITVRTPEQDDRTRYVKTGATGMQLHLGSGGNGNMTAAISRLRTLPWNPFGFVGGGGQTVDLDPGWYSVSTSWRRSETTVVLSVQAVEVRRDEIAVVRTPDFPNTTRGPEVGPGTWILRYPRR